MTSAQLDMSSKTMSISFSRDHQHFSLRDYMKNINCVSLRKLLTDY